MSREMWCLDHVQVWVEVEGRILLSRLLQPRSRAPQISPGRLPEGGMRRGKGADSRKSHHYLPHVSAHLCSAAVRSLSPAEHDLTIKS